MNGLLIIGGFVAVPLLGVVLLRASGVMAFLGLCLGTVLANYVASDASSVLTAASRGSHLATMQWVQIALLLLPVLLMIALTRKKTKGLKLILSALAAVVAGALALLFTEPYLSHSLQSSIEQVPVWKQLNNLETALIILGVILTVVHLVLTRAKSDEKSEKKHK